MSSCEGYKHQNEIQINFHQPYSVNLSVFARFFYSDSNSSIIADSMSIKVSDFL